MLPVGDVTIAITSIKNITFTCRLSKGDPSIDIVWEIRGVQIESEERRQKYAGYGIFIEDVAATLSILVVTADGRSNLGPDHIQIHCSSYNKINITKGITAKSQQSCIVLFGT